MQIPATGTTTQTVESAHAGLEDLVREALQKNPAIQSALHTVETVITLKPQSDWPKRKRWYSERAPNWLHGILGRFWPDRKTTQEVIYGPGGLNDALTMPGIANAWPMPIKARIDMLTTGVRTPLGIKVLGSDLSEIEKVGGQIEMALKDIPGTTSVFAERTTGGYFLDFDLKRDQLARYGLTVDDANDVLCPLLAVSL